MKFSGFSICIAFLMLMITGSCSSVIVKQNKQLTPGQKVIDQVTKDERTSFILYQLALALNSHTAPVLLEPNTHFNLVSLYVEEGEKFKHINTYESYANDLLAWVKRRYGATDQEVYVMVRSGPRGQGSLLCTSNGMCYSSDTIGSFCCPF